MVYAERLGPPMPGTNLSGDKYTFEVFKQLIPGWSSSSNAVRVQRRIAVSYSVKNSSASATTCSAPDCIRYTCEHLRTKRIHKQNRVRNLVWLARPHSTVTEQTHHPFDIALSSFPCRLTGPCLVGNVGITSLLFGRGLFRKYWCRSAFLRSAVPAAVQRIRQVMKEKGSSRTRRERGERDFCISVSMSILVRAAAAMTATSPPRSSTTTLLRP